MLTIELVAMFLILRSKASAPDAQRLVPLMLMIVKAPETNHEKILAQQQQKQSQHLFKNAVGPLRSLPCGTKIS
jgi:hypothetical protein